jgi:hypothetical protein
VRCGRQCSATCGCPGGQWRAAGGAPASVASPLGTIPAAVDVMHRSTPAQRKDRWAFRHLGVRARRGYGAYGAASTWPRTTSRLERAPAFASQIDDTLPRRVATKPSPHTPRAYARTSSLGESPARRSTISPGHRRVASGEPTPRLSTEPTNPSRTSTRSHGSYPCRTLLSLAPILTGIRASAAAPPLLRRRRSPVTSPADPPLPIERR